MDRDADNSRQSMRAFLSALEEAGQLATISQPVSLEHEIAGCLSQPMTGRHCISRR